jgi:hypothetical protein
MACVIGAILRSSRRADDEEEAGSRGGSTMIRRRCVPVGLAALLTGVIVSPALQPSVPAVAAATAVQGVGGRDDTLALRFRGTGRSEPTEPGRFQWSTDLYSLVTGEKVGTGTNNADMRAPIMDQVMTFHLPDGDLVAHSRESVILDPAHPGFAVVGVHQDNNIAPERGTGAYAGRAGKVTMSGWHDGTRLPEQATFNDFYLIELDPEH